WVALLTRYGRRWGSLPALLRGHLCAVPGCRGRRLLALLTPLALLALWAALGLVGELDRLRGVPLFVLAHGHHIHRGAVSADLGEGLADVTGVEPHPDHGVRAAALRLGGHAVHHFLAGLIHQLGVLGDFTAADGTEAATKFCPILAERTVRPITSPITASTR